MPHVCIKVPDPKEKSLRAAYSQCASREDWVTHQLGPDGKYVGRPKNDGGWYLSPSVKAGSMFANPYSLKDYSLEASLRRFRELVTARLEPMATTDSIIALLPNRLRSLAQARFVGGVEKTEVGKSVAHLKLGCCGDAFRKELKELHGRRLGCFCLESDPCHAKVLSEMAEQEAAKGAAPCAAPVGATESSTLKRKRDDGHDDEGVFANHTSYTRTC